MSRQVILLLTIFLVLPYIVFSITTFVVKETEKIALETNASDPDSDLLTITYSKPLSDNGEWQTSYGDAGQYDITITVSDGTTNISENALLIVEKKEEAPIIDLSLPEQKDLSINEAESINFSVTASDLNNDKIAYEWHVDGNEVHKGQEYTYAASYNDAGIHSVVVIISDGTTTLNSKWNLNVKNVDVESELEKINDIIVDENEIAGLVLPDIEKYGLTYAISEPIGNDNEWRTNYDDAGLYNITVHVEGKGFSKDKTVRLIVNDVDRAPAFDRLENKYANENNEITIALNAQDPDNDVINYSANSMPSGAILENNVFKWTPDYDTVKKEGIVDAIMDKFRVLSKSFYIQFVASAKDKSILQNVIITVKDINRAPVIDDIPPITINEDEIVRIVPNAYDIDGDKVSLSYSGFMSGDTYKSTFDDSGTYYVKVLASDGMLESSKFAQINILQSNRAPIFEELPEMKSLEDNSIAILLNSHDPDGDEISYSVDNAPEGSSLKGNAFYWTPSFDVASKGETKKLDLVFVARDGQAETRQIAKLEITDKNRAPKVIDATKSLVANVNQAVLMFVKATDEDNDDLSYTWDFGILEKYKATSTHQRTFTSRGTKTVKVTVSDGLDEVEQLISVNVV